MSLVHHGMSFCVKKSFSFSLALADITRVCFLSLILRSTAVKIAELDYHRC